ncbi:NAD(P)H-hydrate dehydratase [Rhizobium sp. LjRoot30]|uniref:NAD(P)H-hydrate dehydratase n=1 Tax=Rhizobium sp. LjRoot30 TaxID=3342320 RepID=UPI003ECEF410
MSVSIEHLLLTPAEMGACDSAAAASGIDSFGLMERAGQAVAASALRHFPEACRFVVLCGPGNNGGDGYVAARALVESGAEVAVFHLGDPAALRGDAAKARASCPAVSAPIEDYGPQPDDMVIDALFGAGLSRPVPPAVADVIERVRAAGTAVLAVDLPSGVCGLRGLALGTAFQAKRTVTFMTAKPGHRLMPGRSLCGDVEIFDIGMPHRIVERHAGPLCENTPAIWIDHLPETGVDAHKFRRGHLVVFSGGPTTTGAARLSSRAGFRIGAGLVTLASPAEALAVNAGALTSVMLREVNDAAALTAWIEDARLSAFVLGPGFGIGEKARQFVTALFQRPLVLDADGISSFRETPEALFSLFAGGKTRLVLTPHEGEFARLFPDIATADKFGKTEKALRAAARAHAVIVFKGADTVIAAPDGRAAINVNAPQWLATAGSGDVLAGMIGGLMAQGMPAYEAACAAVYRHGEAGTRLGEGLTSEDLAETVRRA